MPNTIIGIQRDQWRKRTIVIYDIPGKPNQVLTIGRPWDGTPAVERTEARSRFARAIRLYAGERSSVENLRKPREVRP